MKKKFAGRSRMLLIILFLGFTSCIYAPYELYLTNRKEFWFDFTDFWWIPLVCGGMAMSAAALIGMLLRGRLLRIYEGLLLGGGLSVYIQGNFLNLKLGVLNGAAIDWESYRGHMILDILIIAFLFAGSVTLCLIRRKTLDRILIGAAGMLTAMQAVSLIVLFIPAVAEVWERKNTESDKEGFLSDKALYEVGGENSIVVFLVDMFDDQYMKEIVRQEPEITAQLQGFTQYTNSVGSYSATKLSLAKLFTGVYFHNEDGFSRWLDQTGEGPLWCDELLKNGYELNLYSEDGMFPQRLETAAVNYQEAPLRINHYKDFTLDLYRLVMCKYFPDMIKPYIWMTGNEFERWKEPDSEYHAYDLDNIIFRDRVQKYGVQKAEGKKQFKFIHINGSHFPYNIDENARQVASDSVTAVQCARGALRIVQNYMDDMKAAGVYDSSSILIMADHGYYWDGVLTSPVLLAKPAGAGGDLKFCSSPVSHDDFPATILELADLNDGRRYGRSIFEIGEGEQRKRLFYQYYLKEKGSENRRLIEYMVDSDGNTREHFYLTDVEYTVDGRKIEHSKHCALCQAGGPTEEEIKEYDPPRIVHRRMEGMKVK